MTRKKIIFLGIGGLIIILGIAMLVFWQINSRRLQTVNVENPNLNFQPEFMTPVEKAEKGITSDLRIQVITRDASGTINVYKIIRKDSDIKNPAEIKPISPRQN